MNILVQPSSSGITYCRSPIVYAFGDLTDASYRIDLYVTKGRLVGGSPYVQINRTVDSNSTISVDVSNILVNYLKNNTFNFSENKNVAKYTVNLIAFDVTGGTVATYPTNTCYTTMGYTHYAQKGSGVFNITDYDDFTEYILNSQQVNVPYAIPYEHYEIAWRYNAISTDIIFVYTKLSDGEPWFDYFEINSGKTTASDELRTFPVGMKDLTEYWNISDIDISKPHSVYFLDGLTAISGTTYLFEPEDYCEDSLTTLQFLNKYGVWDFFYFTGKRDTELNVEYEQYKHNKIDTTTMTYKPEFGQFHKSFINAKRKIILNTGWLDDVKNAKLQELLLSEYVFDYNTRLPVIITDKTLRFKTVKYDKLIQYTLTCEEAYDTINSIV